MELELDKRILIITLCVVISQDLQRLLVTAFGAEPTRRLGDEDDKTRLEEGNDTLEDGWNTP